MGSELYTNIYVSINSSLLAEAASIEISRKSGASKVYTILKGFAGVSPGATEMEVKIQTMVPAAGFEYDTSTVIGELVPVEIQLAGPGGRSLISQGFITEDDLKKAVNGNAEMNFTFMGNYAKWQ